MAGGKGDGDRSIGSSHILGLFFGTVLLCCIFFVLGFVMGRDQARSSGRVDLAPKPAATESAPPAGWSISTPASGNPSAPASGNPVEFPKPAAKSSASPAPAKSVPAQTKPVIAGKYDAPLIARGAVVLQIAALTKEQDAQAMAAALQEHGFPTFVLKPTTDNFYRVQVGPYADANSADQAKHSLEREGFKVIIKR